MPGNTSYKNIQALEQKLIALKARSKSEEKEIIHSIKSIREDLRPSRLIKSALIQTVKDPPTRNRVLRIAAGIGIGLLVNKWIGRQKSETVKGVISKTLKSGLAEAAINNREKITSFALSVLKNIFPKKQEEEIEKED